MLPNYKSSKVAEVGVMFVVEWPQLTNFEGSQSIQDDLFFHQFEDDNLKELEDVVVQNQDRADDSEEDSEEEEEEDQPEKKGPGLRLSSVAYQTIASFMSYFGVAVFRQASRQVEGASCKAIICNIAFFKTQLRQLTFPSGKI